MLKLAATTKDGKKLVGLGLSAENVARLVMGDEIVLDLDEFGLPGAQLLLFAGQTEEGMAAGLSELIGPDTKLHVDERLYRGSD